MSTVLLVDDNRAFVENFEEILSAEGYAVRSAGTVEAARAAAQTGFQVALVDVRLPDGDGVECAAHLKQSWPEAEVILLTGFASLESAQAAVRAGAWAYLTKPCATPDLLLAVGQAVRHIDEKAELRKRAQQLERLATIGQLSASLSHEIKNPLNAAALQLSLLERRVRKLEGATQETLLGPLGLVQHEIGRLNEMLEGFLQYARPRELSARPVDAGTLAAHVIDLLRPQAEHLGVHLEGKVPQGVMVAGDASRLQQALLNLTLNAIQAVPRDGWVRIEVVGGDPVELRVEDSGDGVPEALRERMFEPFFTTKAGGSGLGLPLTHAIAMQHGGDLTEESRDAGACFVLRLPALRSGD